MRYLKKNYNLSVEGDRISYIQQILKQLAMVDSSVEREYYLKRLSDEYQLSLETLNEEIKKRRKNLSFPEDNGPKSRYTKSGPILKGRNKLLPAFQNAERLLLAHMLQDIELTNQAQNQIGINFTIDEHKIIATHLYAFYQAVEGPNISGFIDYLEDESLRKIVIEIAMIPLLEDVTSQEINDYFKLIQNRSENLVALNEFREQQKIAEQQNDPIKAATIAVQIIALERKLKK